MRQSNKKAILDAAVTVIESEGITAVTFDSVAAAAGLTRGGILYHFPSRDDLIRALHEHLAGEWERQLTEVCGKSSTEASPAERLTAYIRAAAMSASRAELLMLVESRGTENYQHWADVLMRWTPQPSGHEFGTANDAARLALLAADGLWVNDAITQQPLTPEQRTHTVETIVSQLEEALCQACR